MRVRLGFPDPQDALSTPGLECGLEFEFSSNASFGPFLLDAGSFSTSNQGFMMNPFRPPLPFLAILALHCSSGETEVEGSGGALAATGGSAGAGVGAGRPSEPPTLSEGDTLSCSRPNGPAEMTIGAVSCTLTGGTVLLSGGVVAILSGDETLGPRVTDPDRRVASVLLAEPCPGDSRRGSTVEGVDGACEVELVELARGTEVVDGVEYGSRARIVAHCPDGLWAFAGADVGSYRVDLDPDSFALEAEDCIVF